MITRIEARNYRCLRYVRQDLGPFHVLVGPNASGKTTFLDVVAFLGRLVTDGPEAAVVERTQNFQDLVWGRGGCLWFELAIEGAIPERLKENFVGRGFDTIRYEVKIGANEQTNEVEIFAERALLESSTQSELERHHRRDLFPSPPEPPDTILTQRLSTRAVKTVINKVRGGNDNYDSEVHQESGKGWAPAFKLGPRKSALGNLPADDTQFPVTTWLKELLSDGVQPVVLNSLLMRKASPPLRGHGFRPDGSNLPWVVESLRKRAPDRFRDWIGHLRTALPDVEDSRTIERQDDRHRYLMIGYRGGLEVPSWMASDGTLRLLALTLPAYLGDFSGIYLIEEPENGIHPRAVETVFQSLSSVYDAQILVATHSPVILGIAEPSTVLCFAKSEEEATDIVLGSDHPALRDWRGETNLGVLFAAGVLG